MLQRALLFGAGLTLSACLLPDSSGLVGGRPTSEQVSSPPADAESEPDAFDAGSGTLCSGAEHRLCDDFDEPGAGFPKWDSVTGSPSFAQDFASPPRSMELVAPPWTQDGGFPYSGPSLAKQVAARTTLACEFDLKVVQKTADLLLVAANVGTWRTSLTIAGTTIRLYEVTGTTAGNFAVVSNVLLDKWNHVKFAFDVDHETLTIPPDAPVSAPSTFPGVAGGKVSLTFGNLQAASMTEAKVRIDNVVCD